MMSKTRLIAINEYKRLVFKRSFILALLSVPLFIGFIIAMGYVASSFENNDAPIGIVDHPGVFTNPIPAPVDSSDDRIEFIFFPDEASARNSLQENEIQAYYIFSTDYFETSQIELVYVKEPGSNAVSQFYNFLQINLVSDLPLEKATRIAAGNNITIRSPDGSREFPGGGPPFGVVLPLLIAIAFVILFLLSAGYLMEGIVQERENRMMEVIMTTISPIQLIVGKVLGIVGTNFTQLIIWLLVGVIALFVGNQVMEFSWLQDPQIDGRGLAMVVLIAIPTYLLSASLLFTAGSLIAKVQDAQGIGPLIFMAFMIPSYAVVAIGEEPNGVVAIVLSLIPFASLTTIAVRGMFIAIPLWQFGLSLVIQSGLAVGMLWVSSKAFRLGMLRYGQRIRLASIFRRGPKSGSALEFQEGSK
jgi:ABC-2 type transport system permease protein